MNKWKKKIIRKYIIDENSVWGAVSQVDSELDNGGNLWLRRLVELEKSGMESNMTLNRVLIILAEKLLEVIKTFIKEKLKAIKILKYGKEKVHTFIEDFERYTKKQLLRDKKKLGGRFKEVL